MKLSLMQSIKIQMFPSLATPKDLSDCIVWLRASECLSSDAAGNVVSWRDLASGWELTPSDPRRAPQFVGWCPTLHGRPGVSFSEGTLPLDKIGDLDLPFADAPFSLFTVLSPENEGNADAVVALWAGTLAHAGMRFDWRGQLQGWIEALIDSARWPKQFGPHVLGMVFGNGILRIYVDGQLANRVEDIQCFAENNGDDAVFSIGGNTMGGDGFLGHVGDVAIYGRALSLEEVRYLTRALEVHYRMHDGWIRRIGRAIGGAFHLLASETSHLFGVHPEHR